MSNKAYFPRGNADWQDNHEPIATSRWMSESDTLEHFAEEEGAVSPFIFGKLEDEYGREQVLAYDDDSGVVTFAGTRAGKGVSLIVPNLLSYKGPAIVLDLKGENSSITAEYREANLDQEVAVFDPYGETDFISASLNMLEFYDPDDDEFLDDITEFAEAMIIRGNENDPHWNESARSVIKMILVYIVLDGGRNKHLIELRRLILRGQSKSERPNYKRPVFEYDDSLSELENEEIQSEIEYEIWEDQQASFYQFLKNLSVHRHDYVAGNAQRLLQAGEKERGSIVSSVQRHTEFLDSKSIHKMLINNSFDLSKLREATVYLVLPVRRLDSQARLLRMMITVMLKQLQTDKKKSSNDPSLLMVLDECAALGQMPILELAAGYTSGFGIKLWTIWQDLSQLKKCFVNSHDTIIGNAGIFTAFGNIDNTTLEYVSKRCGKCEVPRLEENYSGGTSQSINQAGFEQMAKSAISVVDNGGSSGESDSYNIRPSYVISNLILPEEVGRYFGKSTQKILVLFGQGQPCFADRIIYYEDDPYRSRAGTNPLHVD